MSKKIKFITIIIVVLFTFLNSIAQNSSKIKNLKGSINIIESTDNYFAIITYLPEVYKNIVYLFDEKGNKLFEKGDFESSVLKAVTIESLNIFVVITQGCIGRDGLIRAYNLKDFSIIWETYSNASSFEVSPDGRHILTKAPDFELDSPFEIIKLQDGSKIIPKINAGYYSAGWLDNQRIIIGKQIATRNPKFKEEYRLINKELEKINQSMFKLRIQVKNKEISKKEYQEQYSLIQPKRESLAKKKSSIGKNIRIWLDEGSYMRIYNIDKNEIELEQFIFVEEKIPFNLCEENIFGNINVDVNKNIYLYGYIQSKDKNSMKTHCLLKLDKNLNLIWKNNIEKYSRLMKVVYKNDIEFKVIKKSNIIGKIDNKTGSIIKDNQFISSTDKLREIRFFNGIGPDVMSINGWKINRKNNSITYAFKEIIK